MQAAISGIAQLKYDVSELKQTLARLQVSELKRSLARLEEEVAQYQRKTSLQLDEFRHLMHQEQQRSRVFEESRDSMNSKVQNMQLQLDGGLADLTQHVNAQFQDLFSTGNEQKHVQDREVDATEVVYPGSTDAAVQMVTCEPTRNAMSGRMTIEMPDSDVRFKVEADVEYDWQASVWDAAVFIHTPAMPHSSSFSVALCLLLVLCFVLLSLLMCYDMVKDKDFDAESRGDFNTWRTNVAHDVALRDKASGQSLARNVCDRNYAIPYSTVQIDAVNVIQSYIGSRFGPAPMGKVMCCLALSIWYLTLGLELRSIQAVVKAFSHVPVEQRTRFHPAPGDLSLNPKLQLVAISVGRIAFVILVCLLRFATLVLLCLIGTLYLCYETSPEDMLLNSLAMQVILNFDEVVYEAVLPTLVQVALKNIMPLTYTQKQKQSIMLGNLLLNLSIYVVLLWGGIFFVVDPFVVEILANHDALCGGVESSLDFVMAVDSIGIPWAAETPKNGGTLMTYARSAVSQVMAEGFAQTHENLAATERSNLGYFMQVASGFALESLTTGGKMFEYPKDWEVITLENAGGILGWNEIGIFKDQDFGDARGTVYNNYLKFLLGSSRQSTINCSDVPAERCYSFGSFAEDMVMRQLCPVKCGCDLPSSGSVSTPFSVSSRFGFMGCGPANLRKNRFVNRLSELPCTDTGSIDAFTAWAQGVGNAPSHNHSYRMLFDEIMASFRRGGCGEVVKTSVGHELATFCDESSLPAICPESCGCVIGKPWVYTDAQRRDFCPYSCGATEPPCMTINVTHEIYGGDRYVGPGYACTFPFRYEGQVYYTCTDADWQGLWCPVTVRNSDLRVEFWGDCPATCA